MGELYRLDFQNGRSYVGMSASARRRLQKHRHEAKHSTKGHLYDAWRQHGEPRMTILAVVGVADMLSTEQRAITAFGTLWPAGYNASPGGHQLTAGIAERISKAQKGRKFSKTHCAKLARAKRGATIPAAVRAKMSAAQRARRAAEGCTPQRWRYP